VRPDEAIMQYDIERARKWRATLQTVVAVSLYVVMIAGSIVILHSP
jgi:succinate dehydrogenase hydrophobic anchor subunit